MQRISENRRLARLKGRPARHTEQERPSGRSQFFPPATEEEGMCGIAGYSLSPDSRVDRTLAAQALLAAIAERGADAVGYAWRERGGAIEVRKQRSGATDLIDRLAVPAHTTQTLV